MSQATALLVVRPWGALRRGDVIRDMAEIARVLAGPHAADVLRVPVEVENG